MTRPWTLPEPVARLARERGHAEVSLRAFGAAREDLDVALGAGAAPRFEQATAVVACCLRDRDHRPLGRDIVRELTVGERIACLLAIVSLAGEQPLEVAGRCPGCGETIEMAVPTRDVIEFHRARQAARLAVSLGEAGIDLRVPTGADQERWYAAAASGGADFAREALRSLAGKRADVVAELDVESMSRIDEALAEIDPLVDFVLQSACPSCDAAVGVEVDLEGVALERLGRARVWLLAGIHRLARAYHWSEEQILALPAWRRHHYLSLLERES